ncbi:hypothetical protein BDR07DRAFT_1378298 [Suillus spraguei]|nr:hypothetical protein BDR07DRAFT_1378298 [Suillus spraguei]
MTYIYNSRPRVITLFEHTGSFRDLDLDLDFASYNLSSMHIGPCYWPTEVSIEEFWPLSDEPLGYIAMNDHGGPHVVPSERKDYDVLDLTTHKGLFKLTGTSTGTTVSTSTIASIILSTVNGTINGVVNSTFTNTARAASRANFVAMGSCIPRCNEAHN